MGEVIFGCLLFVLFIFIFCIMCEWLLLPFTIKNGLEAIVKAIKEKR